jgi:hypothetical protein
MASFKTSNTAYPDTMRTQLWPLCCGASIISGFKNVGTMDHDELVKAITDTCSEVPDHQVYQNEKIIPKMTYLTLNEQQTQSVKIMSAVLDAGFVKFATAKPRGSLQSFFVRDISNTFKLEQDTKVAA